MATSMTLTLPPGMAASCQKTPERMAWLRRLPETLRNLQEKFSIVLGAPFCGEDVTCSYVAPAHLPDGTSAVFKLGMPHMESEQEAEGLRVWNGDPTVRLLAADEETSAMLLETCEPGTPLTILSEPVQDIVIAGLLRRLWREPPAERAFRPLSALLEHWSNETSAYSEKWSDAGLVREGLRLFAELPGTAPTAVLLATDLHAGNVLRAEREPWLVIDPKPFIGDPAYDATQHLFNCMDRLRANPVGTMQRIAEMLGVEYERVRLWTFARAAAEPRENWQNSERLALASAIAP